MQIGERARRKKLVCHLGVHHWRRFGALGIHRKIEKHRARLPTLAKGPRNGLVELLQNQIGLAYRARVAGQPLDKPGVQHILQSPAVLLPAWWRTREHEQRRARRVGVRDPCHRVCHPGTGRHQRNPQAPAQLAISVCHVNRRPFVSNIDDLNTLGVEAHPDRHDVPAAKREHPIDPARLQKSRDQCSATRIGNNSRHFLVLIQGSTTRIIAF